jgi:hypothetical protein
MLITDFKDFANFKIAHKLVSVSLNENAKIKKGHLKNVLF